jgi:hypothetical protein
MQHPHEIFSLAEHALLCSADHHLGIVNSGLNARSTFKGEWLVVLGMDSYTNQSENDSLHFIQPSRLCITETGETELKSEASTSPYNT